MCANASRLQQRLNRLKDTGFHIACGRRLERCNEQPILHKHCISVCAANVHA
jgi:hypothetical protein